MTSTMNHLRLKISLSFLEGLQSLRYNPLRSFLTMIGIVVGIAAVVTVLAIGKGHEAKIEAQIQQMGALWFWIEPGHSFRADLSKRVSRTPHAGHQIASYQTRPLSCRDADAISRSCSAVAWTAPVAQYVSQSSLRSGRTRLHVVATTSSYQKVKSLRLVSGRYLIPGDLRDFKKVCVIEEQSGLFTAEGALKQIRIQGHEFRIVGIFRRSLPNSFSFRSMTTHVPLTTAQKILGITSVQRIDCKAKKRQLRRAVSQVREALRSRAQSSAGYAIRTARDFFRRAEDIAQTATLVTAGIGMLSLFVGGIGIMNILLASVQERTHEVGIGRAVGAKKKDILLQFLFESVLLSLVGGCLGILLGIFCGKLLGAAIEILAVFSIDTVLIALCYSGLIGVIFGVYPAWKAARLRPAEALRHE